MRQVLCILAVGLLAVSCSKEETVTPGQDFLRGGKWKQTSGKVKQKGVNLDTTLNYFNDAPDCFKDNYVEFGENFDGIVHSGGSKCDPADPDQAAFTWELLNQGKNLNIYTAEDFFGTDNVQAEVVTLNDNTLAIKYTVIVRSPMDDTKYDTLTFNNGYRKE